MIRIVLNKELPLTRFWDDFCHKITSVIPAQAGIQEIFVRLQVFSWVPDSRFALSGMTPAEWGKENLPFSKFQILRNRLSDYWTLITDSPSGGAPCSL